MKMSCPECGSIMYRHAEGTFEQDGWICIECEYIKKEDPEKTSQTFKGIIIKGWRKAWWES